MTLRIHGWPHPDTGARIHHDVCGKDHGLLCGREPDHDGHCAPRGGGKKDR